MSEKNPDYFPLESGTRLEYESKTPSSMGILTIEVLFVTKAPGLIEAECRRTVLRDGKTAVSDFKIQKNETGVFSGAVREFPLPAKPGQTWQAYPRSYEIAADDATVTVPAGVFKNCLKVSYLIAEGDGGEGERFYAPGVGFIYENCGDVGHPFKISLTRCAT